MRLSIQTIFHLFSLTIIFSPALLYLINPSQNIQSIQPFLSQIFSRSNPSYPRYSVDPTRPILDIQSIQPFPLLDIQSIQLFLSQISSQTHPFPLLDIQSIQPFLPQISSQSNPFFWISSQPNPSNHPRNRLTSDQSIQQISVILIHNPSPPPALLSRALRFEF